jgi:hypothetical protein
VDNLRKAMIVLVVNLHAPVLVADLAKRLPGLRRIL